MPDSIHWGIIGCGNVTEIKSGPAFNKVSQSKLMAVMRRDSALAKDYATRHQVPRWYDDAMALLQDPEINAIYIATPPSSHEMYAIEALKAGKFVYLEKPMSTTVESCLRIAEVAKQVSGKLSIAHYRRALPKFLRIKELVQEEAIGEIRTIQLRMLQPFRPGTAETGWRVDPAIGGNGGLFYDLAPHQLDILYWIFGAANKVMGISGNQLNQYASRDLVSGMIEYPHGIVFNGIWCFSVDSHQQQDICELIGSKGKISFSFFGHEIYLEKGDQKEKIEFAPFDHIQQPMIQAVVHYFNDQGENPCSAEDAIETMKIMERFIQ